MNILSLFRSRQRGTWLTFAGIAAKQAATPLVAYTAWILAAAAAIGYATENAAAFTLALFVAVFVPFTHRKNIRRLVKGEENRFDFRRKKKNPE